ncbi:MAG: cytochrome c3 family protein [Sulfurimonas sp.]|nr:cytochrome c3 family protein [Sulfurimonas sp.]
MKLIIFVILGLLFINAELTGSIINTKHNLSVSNTVVPDANETIIKAQSEQEVCVFCHIPHFTRPVGKPLWNRSMPVTNYNMYDSTYLRRLGYPALATDLGSANDTPGALSRQCLSCHDGTIAVGSVYKLRRKYMGIDKIAMDGVDGSGFIPASKAGLIGTDLSVHHPVGVEYDTTVTKTFGDASTRTSELLNLPTSPIKLYAYASNPGQKFIECSSCHDPHKDAANANGESNKFLHVSSGTTLAENIVTTCISCHDKRNGIAGTDNPHKLATESYTTTGVSAEYGTAVVGKFYCVNCHTPHNAQSGQAYLQRKVEQNTCYMGVSNDRTTAPCHGTGSILGRIDIESILDRPYGHGLVNTLDGVHTNLDTLYGTNVTRYPATTKGLEFSDSKHVECVDCHNPHKVAALPHVADNEIYPATPTNLVSGVLQGVNGVEPTWPTAWLQPTTFTTMESAEKEYQICFKCHSYWGLGNNVTANTPDSLYASVSDPVNVPLTDVAWEMNKNNRSGHPVVINANGRTGASYEPKAIPQRALLAPWTAGVSTMYCSDCHGSDDELNVVDPKGPHGSNKKWMLKSSTGNYYWPYKADGITAYDTDDINTAGDTGLFCKNCHDLTTPHKEWNSWMRSRNLKCINCHVAIPHGSPVSRLIGYSTFPAPYDYQNNSLMITRYIKNSVINSNDIAGTSCGGMMCHGGNSVPGYDVSPMP